MRDRLTLRSIWIYIAIPLAYFGISLVVTWPLATHITTHLPGGSNDVLVHYWNGWWVNEAFSNGQSPFHTPLLYHPTGLSLVYHNFSWMNILPWSVVHRWVGGFAAYNLIVLANLTLCGITAFLLAQKLTGDKRAAFLAGLIYLAWPYRLSQLDHPNLISTQWIPAFLLFLILTVRSDLSPRKDADTLPQVKWRSAVLAGFFLALVGYTRWQLLIPAAVLGGIYLLSTLPYRDNLRRYWVLAILVAGVVAILALAPPALMLFREQRTAPAELVREDEETNMQTDVLAYLTPSRSHPLLSSLTRLAYSRYYPNRHENRHFAAYIGVTALVLVSLGIASKRYRRASLPWIVMVLVLILLALGPVLRVNGQLYPDLPMPYRLAARSYIVRLMRVPDRFNMFLALPIAILSAYGVAWVLGRVQRRGRWAALTVWCLLVGLVLLEYINVPVPLQRPRESQFYEQLYAEPTDIAILNLPLNADDSKRYMFAQVTHQHPIVQGKTPRFPQGTFDFISNHPWLQALRASSTMPPGGTDVSRQLATLAQDGVRYVILHKNTAHPLRLDHWRNYFLIPPLFEDDVIVVYPTIPLAGEDYTLMNELAAGIGPVRVTTSANCLSPGRPLHMDIGWGTTSPPEQDYDIKLILVSDEEQALYEETFALAPGWPTREWPANATAWGAYTLRIPPALPSGDYNVALALVDPATGETRGQSIAVADVQVSETTCSFPIPPEADTVDALFGDVLRLMGYQLHRDGDQLTVTLHWRAEQLMDTDYKVFVHVFDPKTGVRAAQDDAMPLRWTHPTTYWKSHDTVTDDIPLSLENAPAGTYSVLVGVYDPQTGERLPVMGNSGQLQPDSQMMLPASEIKVETQGP